MSDHRAQALIDIGSLSRHRGLLAYEDPGRCVATTEPLYPGNALCMMVLDDVGDNIFTRSLTDDWPAPVGHKVFFQLDWIGWRQPWQPDRRLFVYSHSWQHLDKLRNMIDDWAAEAKRE